jgi:alpha-glucosidase
MDGFRVFTWDRERFPKPAETIAALQKQDIRAVTILDPGVKKERAAGYTVADSGIAGGHFVRGSDGKLHSGQGWPGESLFPDFCRTATRRWWGDLHGDLTEIGIDGVWRDTNEPKIGDNHFGSRRMRGQVEWQHTRTSNPTESTFATVRLRTARPEDASRATASSARSTGSA